MHRNLNKKISHPCQEKDVSQKMFISMETYRKTFGFKQVGLKVITKSKQNHLIKKSFSRKILMAHASSVKTKKLL